jgi:sugar-phosphatase
MSSVILAAVLLDMDGTLVDSDAVVERVWTGWSRRRGVDLAEVLRVTPGRPARDSLRLLAPDLTDTERDADAAEMLELERTDLAGVVAAKGARELVTLLTRWRVPYAVVTSADRPLAVVRLGAAGIEPPAVLVTSSETVRGKPDPEGYLAAAAALGVAPADALVVEDTAAGVQAGKAAGCHVAGLRGAPGSDVDVPDLCALQDLLGSPASGRLTLTR